eukprot:COSAG02_NODE_4266_length_5569_cov_14.425594_5_plen_41_part_01
MFQCVVAIELGGVEFQAGTFHWAGAIEASILILAMIVTHRL